MVVVALSVASSIELPLALIRSFSLQLTRVHDAPPPFAFSETLFDNQISCHFIFFLSLVLLFLLPLSHRCIVCDDPFCAVHWDDLHRSGKRATHPFCLIDPETGAVDVNATSVIGGSAGRFGHIGPPLRGGGDDGQVGIFEPEAHEEKEEEEAAAGYYAGEGGEGLAVAAAGAEGGGALQGGWEQFEDETGVPYWYNAESGESTYDDPGAGGGGASAAAAAAGSGEVSSDWQEARDEEGNMYYHNATTGESTYDSPHG